MEFWRAADGCHKVKIDGFMAFDPLVVLEISFGMDVLVVAGLRYEGVLNGVDESDDSGFDAGLFVDFADGGFLFGFVVIGCSFGEGDEEGVLPWWPGESFTEEDIVLSVVVWPGDDTAGGP